MRSGRAGDPRGGAPRDATADDPGGWCYTPIEETEPQYGFASGNGCAPPPRMLSGPQPIPCWSEWQIRPIGVEIAIVEEGRRRVLGRAMHRTDGNGSWPLEGLVTPSFRADAPLRLQLTITDGAATLDRAVLDARDVLRGWENSPAPIVIRGERNAWVWVRTVLARSGR